MKSHGRTNASSDTEVSATPDEIRSALKAVMLSGEFEGSNRLLDFVEYIVEQHLKDQSRKIPAKTIAHDLYGVSFKAGDESINVVRVDAGRLRRRLAEYYGGSGSNDPLVIHIDTGGYTPRFEVRVRPEVAEVASSVPMMSHIQKKSKVIPAIGVMLSTFGLGILVGYLATPKQIKSDTAAALSPAPTLDQTEIKRQALMTKSPSSIQAVTIAEQAQSLIFPVSEPGQLKLTAALFREAVRRDNTYFAGYAGGAMSLSMLALFSPEGPEREGFLDEARILVDQSVDLASSEAWTQAALAWTYFAEGQTDLALDHIEIALQLAPTDGNILDYYAFMMLSVGNFDAAIEAADPDRERLGRAGVFANNSILGAANFHLGRYEQSIEAILTGTFAGNPISGPTLGYLAAASDALGRDQDARQYAAQLQENWPAFRADVVLGRLYVDPNQAMAIHEHLLAAGWTENADLKTDGGNAD